MKEKDWVKVKLIIVVILAACIFGYLFYDLVVLYPQRLRVCFEKVKKEYQSILEENFHGLTIINVSSVSSGNVVIKCSLKNLSDIARKNNLAVYRTGYLKIYISPGQELVGRYSFHVFLKDGDLMKEYRSVIVLKKSGTYFSMKYHWEEEK